MLTQDRMAHLALLARLAPKPDELARFGAQCDDILQYMDVLAQVDTNGVMPLYSPVEHDSAVRPDEAVARRTRDEVLANAPQTDGTFFVVPRIV